MRPLTYCWSRCPPLALKAPLLANVKHIVSAREKTAVILRDFDTDMLDFLSNLCIHCIEARKLRHLLRAQPAHPQWVSKLRSRCVLEDITPLTSKERSDLKEMWGDKTCDRILELINHHENYQLTRWVPRTILHDPAERWTRQLWNSTRSVLNLPSGMAPGDLRDCDLVVDVLQGSTRTMKNLLAAPHIHGHRRNILRWGEERMPDTKFKEFPTETDKLYAYAPHYYKDEGMPSLDSLAGFYMLDSDEYTGVPVTLINVDEISAVAVDPTFSNINAAAQPHLILNIGYPIGAQSADIMRCLILVFGKSIRSVNIIGKAGGIEEGAEKYDVLIAEAVVSDDLHDNLQLDPQHDIDIDSIILLEENKKRTGCMLTSVGTILQNDDLLRFFRNIFGCVGVEMEAYHYAAEIARGKQTGVLNENIMQRFLYYVSDLPFEPEKTLAAEDDNFDEGVPSMTACFRACLHCIFMPQTESIGAET